MRIGARHSRWTRLLAVGMSLVVLVASSLAMACIGPGGERRHAEVSAAAPSTAPVHDCHGNAGARDEHGNHHAGHHTGHHTSGALHDEQSAPDPSDGDEPASHVCVCDFACHHVWTFADVHVVLDGVNYTRLSYGWPSRALFGAHPSTLDRPPKSLVSV